MNFKLVPISIVLLATSVQAEPTNAKDAVRKVVQSFYIWYAPIARQDHKGPAFLIALKQKPHLFSPELSQALFADARAQSIAKGEIVGINWDPFLNTQDPCSHYKIGEVKLNGGTFSVTIYASEPGDNALQAVVVAELMYSNSQWVFFNFRFNDGSDLLGILNSLEKDRRGSRK